MFLSLSDAFKSSRPHRRRPLFFLCGSSARYHRFRCSILPISPSQDAEGSLEREVCRSSLGEVTYRRRSHLAFHLFLTTFSISTGTTSKVHVPSEPPSHLERNTNLPYSTIGQRTHEAQSRKRDASSLPLSIPSLPLSHSPNPTLEHAVKKKNRLDSKVDV